MQHATQQSQHPQSQSPGTNKPGQQTTATLNYLITTNLMRALACVPSPLFDRSAAGAWLALARDLQHRSHKTFTRIRLHSLIKAQTEPEDT